MKRVAALLLLCAFGVFAQANDGELHLKITDPSGLGVKTAVEIQSEANQYHNTLETDEEGTAVAKNLPYGVYRITIREPGFAEVSRKVEVRSSLPTNYEIKLELSPVNAAVTVTEANTLINPDQAGSVSQIGSSTIQDRFTSLPGRSLQDLVNSQPGWLYEGNAVLHPRGSEYQTQFVIDGIPLTDNRSPSLGPEIEADDVQSMTVYTAGIPAEYGRKMGGVIEVNTILDTQPGFHGQAVLSGGSFDTAGMFGQAQYAWGKNSVAFSADGSMTDHYLNPVVPENFTNAGTTGDFSADFERDLTAKDHIDLTVRHELARYEIPNEFVQQAAGQRQDADNFETMGIASYQHVFSANAVADVRAMVRENSNDFNSNADSTPVEVFQHNWFREGYFKGTITIDHGHHEWKFGAESDNMFLNEDFRDAITDPTQFEPSTPLTFAFLANRPDLEQSAFAQDLMRLGNWTISAGLRWDHYQLLLNRQSLSPRFSISRYFPAADLMLHFSYDRVFQTPSFENILLSSSTAAANLDTISLQLPLEPSEGNYYEVGLTKAFFKRFKLDANYYRRYFNNFADDDQIQNTTISFPIAFRKAVIYGSDAKIDLPSWKRFSGFVSYSYQVGNAWFPVTGGLFLGDNAVIPTAGHFPDSQDQRNTVRGRVRYQIAPRLWIAGGIEYDSGLPFAFDGTYDQALAEYGQQVIDRINFARGRIHPSFLVDTSAGVDIYRSDPVKVQLQADGENLTNVLDVLDFGGLFSGNAIGPSRSFALRLSTTF
jgi:Carboxypeptidase regulatory-like domain/TonB-dependent Receptor Plug Domain